MTRPPAEIYRLTLHETPSPTVVTDDSFAVVDVNSACLEFTGYAREELLGAPPAFLVDDPDTYDEMVASLADGESWEGEFEAVTKAGERVFGRGATFPLSVDGDVVGYGGIFVDLSERRRTEQTVNVLNRVLRHNIRNDANVVGGVLSTVRDSLSGADRELVDGALDRIERLLDRAETARDLQRLLERSSSALAPVDLRDAVDSVVADVDDATTVHLDCPDDPVWILADDALARGVAAVAENAVDHSHIIAPTVWVSIATTPTEAVLTVADDGPGIDPGRAESLFGRHENSQLRHGEGLSLFFLSRLLDFYGGSVDHRPRDPTGCVFELRFRRVDPPT